MYRRPAYWGKKRRANKGRQAGRPEPAKVRKNASVWWWEWGCGWLVRRANASSKLLWLVGRDIAFEIESTCRVLEDDRIVQVLVDCACDRDWDWQYVFAQWPVSSDSEHPN